MKPVRGDTMKRLLVLSLLIAGMAYANEPPKPRAPESLSTMLISVKIPTVRATTINPIAEPHIGPVAHVNIVDETGNVTPKTTVSRWKPFGPLLIETQRMQDCESITYDPWTKRPSCRVGSSSASIGKYFWTKKDKLPPQQTVLDCKHSLINGFAILPDSDEEVILNTYCPPVSQADNPPTDPKVLSLIKKYSPTQQPQQSQPIQDSRWVEIGHAGQKPVYYDKETIGFYKWNKQTKPEKADKIQLWFKEGSSDTPHLTALYCNSDNPTPESADEVLHKKFCPK
jgi:hypothetical protein